MSFEVQDQSGVHVVRVSGERLTEDKPLVKAVTDLLAAPGTRVVIDLSEIKWIDSGGLSTLVTINTQGNERGCHVVFAGSTFIRGVFETTQLDRFLRVHPSVDAAIASLK